jgi:hypothetical protein
MNTSIRLTNKNNGPTANRVFDKNLIDNLKKIILINWQSNNDNPDFFPAPQPISLERRDLIKLKEYEYVVCAKTDGMRFIMIFYDESCYMVDRAFKIYKTEIVYKKQNNNNNKLLAIFDGELVLNKKNIWKFIIHDCINMDGEYIGDNIFIPRYLEVEKFLETYVLDERCDKYNVKIIKKVFYDFKNLHILKKQLDDDELDHKSDGLIFTPKNKKIGKFTQYDLFKWKPINLHTFDFKINKDETGITAYVNKNGTHIPYAHTPKGSPEELYFSEYLSINCKEFTNNCIVECDYDIINDNYKPLLVRTDKTHSNSYYTVNKTLVNIKENITMEELVDL